MHFLIDKHNINRRLRGFFMKKKKIVLVIIVVLVTVWTIYRAIVPSYSSVLEANWDIELPVKALCKEVYSEDTGPSFHGDGIRYHVFRFTNSSEIEKMLPWSDANGNTLAWSQTEGEEKCYQTYPEATDLWLGELEIPQEQYLIMMVASAGIKMLTITVR